MNVAHLGESCENCKPIFDSTYICISSSNGYDTKYKNLQYINNCSIFQFHHYIFTALTKFHRYVIKSILKLQFVLYANARLCFMYRHTLNGSLVLVVSQYRGMVLLINLLIINGYRRNGRKDTFCHLERILNVYIFYTRCLVTLFFIMTYFFRTK